MWPAPSATITRPELDHAASDYFGRTVNLASRVTGVAGPGEVIAIEAVKSAVDGEA